MCNVSDQVEDLRARRRRETRAHIADVGLRMFQDAGYDQTTMQAVAEASGIAPRTLFHYFKTKNQLLQYWLASDFTDDLRTALLERPADQAPLAAVHSTLSELITRHEDQRSLAVDRVLNSTAELRASKQATFVEWEHALYGALRERWPEPADELRLRTIAMASIGALRLALEARREHPDAPEPLTERLNSAFAALTMLNR
jgi:AcrR family transcriptional regulator